MATQPADLPIKVKTVTVYRGDTKSLPVLVFHSTNPDGTMGPVKDVSDLTWLAQWRTDEDAPTSFTLIVDHSQASIGIIAIKIPATITAAMETDGVWDLQATYPNGDVKTKARGNTRIQLDVSRGPDAQ